MSGRFRPQATAGISLFYFFSFGALGSLLPYLALVLESRGFTPTQVGRIVLLIPAASLVAPPVWGALADLFRARRPLMALAATTCAAALAGLVVEGRTAWTVVGVAIFGVGRAPLAAMADAAAHDALGAASARFSRVRVWGSVGFVVAALSLGRDRVDGAAILGGAAAAYALAAASAWTLPRGRAALKPARVTDLRRAVRTPGLGWLLAATATYTTATGFFDAFMGLHIRSLGFGDAFVGWAWTVGVTAEIALMFAAPRFLDRWGELRLLRFAVIGAAMRWLGFAWVSTPAAVLAVQVLHAFSFALWYLAVVRWVQRTAADEVRTSIQAVLIASMGLGLGLGGGLGGPVFEAWGGRGLFTLGAGVALVAGVLYEGAARRSCRARHAVEEAGRA
jgi:PPP family 3-phenylpropionic acid transporter